MVIVRITPNIYKGEYGRKMTSIIGKSLLMVHSNVHPEIGYGLLDNGTYQGKTQLDCGEGSSWRWKPKKTGSPSEFFTPVVCKNVNDRSSVTTAFG